MRSPADMKVIQIDITNACTKRCGNCTRFCGHQPKPFFMDFETFQQAIDSLHGFEGVVGIMGGEPTIHPQFAKIAAYFRHAFGRDDLGKASYKATPAFIDHITRNVFNFNRGQNNQRGLWTSITSKYAEHFEIIQDTFGVQCVNDHSSPSFHTTLMATRKELGIEDEEWFKLRDNCWVQNNWSASITPKGAFFCEVAAAMDATFDGPGGWPIEPGWWKRKPEDFGDQLKWCEMCSACLPVPKRNANDETDDASPFWVEKLKALGSPKLRKGLVEEFDPAAYDPKQHDITAGEQPYLSSNLQRIGLGQQILAPKEVLPVLDVDETLSAETIRTLITANQAAFGVHALLSDNPAHRAVAEELGVTVLSCHGKTGTDVYADLKATGGPHAWVLLLHGQVIGEDLATMLRTHVFNPGCFYTLHNAAGRPGFIVDFFNVNATALAQGADLFTLARRYTPAKVQVAAAPPALKPAAPVAVPPAAAALAPTALAS